VGFDLESFKSPETSEKILKNPLPIGKLFRTVDDRQGKTSFRVEPKFCSDPGLEFPNYLTIRSSSQGLVRGMIDVLAQESH